MQLLASINIKSLQPPITYKDNILLTGSCFTEHIGNYLMDVKFNVLQNPNGILFNPLSICSSLVSYIHNKQYSEDDLFFFNEAWHSWQHHSRFSNSDLNECLRIINESQNKAHEFLEKADWIIITLGSSFVYKLSPEAPPSLKKGNNIEVANCHKAPAQTFIKHLCTIEETVSALDGTIHQLFHFNPQLKIIFTISPVRHLRDGVVENNRSKARLIEAVHHLINKFDKLYYFPAYELVIDVLRDYRFYDIDLAHPNYAATQFVLEKFSEFCFDESTQELMKEIRKITIAKNHTPFNPHSQQHKKFLQAHLEKTKRLQQQYLWLDFTKELEYFSGEQT
ncbi:MAG TPA: GSCFA domain-containing protein [Chitinophagaceae bacterium]|nr:GSCFA domain-containing protein [Chitinophagaceae bacterium]